jgi:large subunit ribosomal protein L31
MKKGIHPEYRAVVFQDTSCDFAILTKSTIKSSDNIKWADGNTYPLIKLEISSGSHPYFTGKQKLLDTAGRVEKFQKKYSGKKTSKA